MSEFKDYCKHLEVARLRANGLSYRQVSKETGASTTTVTRVAAFLENGQGGYRTLFKAHRHHDFRKKVNEGNTSKETYTEAKRESTKVVQSPLQKHLQKL